jgi:subtilisin family serine protease
MTGTSMASPLAAGIGATLLGQNETFITPYGLCNRLVSLATPGRVQGISGLKYLGSPNRLLYNNNGI